MLMERWMKDEEKEEEEARKMNEHCQQNDYYVCKCIWRECLCVAPMKKDHKQSKYNNNENEVKIAKITAECTLNGVVKSQLK